MSRPDKMTSRPLALVTRAAVVNADEFKHYCTELRHIHWLSLRPPLSVPHLSTSPDIARHD